MRRKTKPQKNNNPQIDISFVKQNKQLDLQENRLNVQILRVHTIEKQRAVHQIFLLQQNQLCQYFTSYELFPYSNIGFNINELLDSNNLKLIKNDGKVYFGQVDRKKRHGYGINVYKDGKVYEGMFLQNQKNGQGVQIYPNGNIYLGEFQTNKKHGHGQFFWFNLSSKNPKDDEYVQYYEGDWWGGLPDGDGVHQKINGDMYTGSFKNGLKHGQGTQYFGNGDFYKGEYVNGLPEGYGQYTWGDGGYYKGDFKQGLRNGYGVWGIKNSSQRYKGQYCMDKKSGYGVYEWQNGWSYKGNFQNDLRNGFGQLYEGKHLNYRGYFQNGQQTDRQIASKQDHKHVGTNYKSSNIYNRSQSNGFTLTNRHDSANQKGQPERQFNKNRSKFSSRDHRTISNNLKQKDDWQADFGFIHHQGKNRDQFVFKKRPQSFTSVNSGTNKRLVATERKTLRSRPSVSKVGSSTIGSTITRPIMKMSNLYVPCKDSRQYI